MKRTDTCPSCKTRLKWEEPGYMAAGSWVCPRCKYRRREGSERTFPWMKRKKEKAVK